MLFLGGKEQLLNVEEDEEFDWQIEQEVPVDEMLQVMIIISIMLCAFPVTSCNYQKLNLSEHSSSYGFAEQHSAVFIKLQVCIQIISSFVLYFIESLSHRMSFQLWWIVLTQIT